MTVLSILFRIVAVIVILGTPAIAAIGAKMMWPHRKDGLAADIGILLTTIAGFGLFSFIARAFLPTPPVEYRVWMFMAYLLLGYGVLRLVWHFPEVSRRNGKKQ